MPHGADAAVTQSPRPCLGGWLFTFLMVFCIAFLVLLLDILESASSWMDAMNQ